MTRLVPSSLAVLLFIDVAASSVGFASKVASLGGVARRSLIKSGAPGLPDAGEDDLHVLPKPDGHRLADREIAPILSIPCLKAKQIDPSNGCTGGVQQHPVGYSEGPLNIATFPDWRDARCRSTGEYLCDPGGLLQDGARHAVAGQLQEIRETVPVTCGPVLQGLAVAGPSMDGLTTDEKRSFNLGTIIINDWPSAEADDESLQKLGLVVMANWEMQERFNGVSLAYETCPNAAVLIILPDQRQAYISSSSCEFVCKDRGGPEVVAAALAGLDAGGAAGAAAAGVAEVKRLLQKTSAASTERASAPRFSQRARDLDRQFAESEEAWSTTQLVVFVVIVGALLVALIGLVAYAMSPPGAGEAMRKMVR